MHSSSVCPPGASDGSAPAGGERKRRKRRVTVAAGVSRAKKLHDNAGRDRQALPGPRRKGVGPQARLAKIGNRSVGTWGTASFSFYPSKTMTNIAAAIGLRQLHRLEDWTQARIANAARVYYPTPIHQQPVFAKMGGYG